MHIRDGMIGLDDKNNGKQMFYVSDGKWLCMKHMDEECKECGF